MKINALSFSSLNIISVCLLISCGGGGDQEAGSLTSLSIVPSIITFTAGSDVPKGACSSGGTAEIFIYGGAAPYRLDNTVKDYVVLNKSQVSDRGGSFNLTVAREYCLSPGNIVVVDALDRSVVLKIENKPAETAK
jgi:hypothetical protein